MEAPYAYNPSLFQCCVVLFYNLEVLRVYYFTINRYKRGQVGYVICNMKTPGEAQVGDTMCS